MHTKQPKKEVPIAESTNSERSLPWWGFAEDVWGWKKIL